jgi:molybdopterin/thiamine biosynthesis adenylyltransferase
LPEENRRKYKILWSRVDRLTEIKLTSFQTAPAAKEALLRRSAYLSKRLSSRKAIIFGIGALGSSIALLLAKAGIGEIRLVDHDVVMPGNAMRHVCGLNLVGLPKTGGAQLAISRHNPDCNVVSFSSSWEAEPLKRYMEGCDIAIDATANHNFSLYLNDLCLAFSQVVIFATAYRRASIGRVIVHRDGDDPCLACYADAPRFWTQHDYPTIPPAPQGAFVEDGCGAVTEEAVALDVEAVANLAARTAVKVTQGELGSRNLAILVNEHNADVEGILAQEGVHWRSNKPLAQCSICRN